MSPRFEEFVVFGVTSVLVSLFAWIYLRDRQKRTGLWMLGWIAILVHFTVPAFADYVPGLMPFTPWLMISTLLIAGTFFLLSVSEVFIVQRRRVAFLFVVSAAAVLYLTGCECTIQAAGFISPCCWLSTVYGTRFRRSVSIGWKGPYLYACSCCCPTWHGRSSGRRMGSFRHGMNFYLFSFFYATGLAYFRHFRRFTPGVLLTSVSFLAWGSVFPLSAILSVPSPAFLVREVSFGTCQSFSWLLE